jgi:hypothetical protein
VNDQTPIQEISNQLAFMRRNHHFHPINMKSLGSLGALLISAFLLSGCIHHESVVRHDSPRVKVEFENETAGRMFYEALSKMHSDGESSIHVEIPVVFEHKEKVITGEGVRFNQAVAECDTNKDGKISEVEARIFADRRH